MRILLLLLFLGLCAAHPVHDTDYSCIVVTNERAKELDDIGKEVTQFITNLADKHDDIDFTFVELKVESHSDYEKDDDKETLLKISVNACNMNPGERVNEDKYFINNDVDTKKSEVEIQSERANCKEDTKRDAVSDIKHDKTKDQRDINSDKASKNNITLGEFNKQLGSESKKKDKKNEIKKLVSDVKTVYTQLREYQKHDKVSDSKASRDTKKRMNRFPFSTNSAIEKDIDHGPETGSVKNNNYNGNYDNSNIYIYAPKFDNSQYVLSNNPDDYSSRYLNDMLFSKFLSNTAKGNYNHKHNGYFTEADNNGYYYPPEDNEYLNANSIDQVFRDVMTNKFKRDDQNANYYLNFGEYGTADFDKNIYTGHSGYDDGYGYH